MSRIFIQHIAKDSGWSFGWGIVNPNCGCLIGMCYLWRLKLGFVLDRFCFQHKDVSKIQSTEEAMQEKMDAAAKAHGETIKAALREAVRENESKHRNGSVGEKG